MDDRAPPDQSSAYRRLGAILAGLGVVAGAFGAHGLESRLSPEDLSTFEVAVRYQIYHALALLLCALWQERGLALTGACRAFTTGILLFSGSLYVLVLADLRWLGAVTPLGGVAFVLGWLLLARAGARQTPS